MSSLISLLCFGCDFIMLFLFFFLSSFVGKSSEMKIWRPFQPALSLWVGTATGQCTAILCWVKLANFFPLLFLLPYSGVQVTVKVASTSCHHQLAQLAEEYIHVHMTFPSLPGFRAVNWRVVNTCNMKNDVECTYDFSISARAYGG